MRVRASQATGIVPIGGPAISMPTGMFVEMQPWTPPHWKWNSLKSCLTLCKPMDCRVHGILQGRILEWVDFPFSRESSQPRDRTRVSHIAGGFFTSWATGKPKNAGVGSLSLFLIQESNWLRNQFGVSCIAGGFFTKWSIREKTIKASKPLLHLGSFVFPLTWSVGYRLSCVWLFVTPRTVSRQTPQSKGFARQEY